MNPTIYLYNKSENGFELCLGGTSTLEGLRVLASDAELTITGFGATSYKKYGWATEKDLPPLKCVGSVIGFLESEGNIGIVAFEAVLPEIGAFSTHDDGECRYVLKSKRQCMSILREVLPSQYRDRLINSLVSNPGLYIACNDTGSVTKYRSFDEYVEKNA